MEQFGSGLVAGISVPNTPIIADALGYAQRLSEPYLFNHAVRSWLFAISIARAKNIDYDSEVVAIGTILHDIGLTDSVTGPNVSRSMVQTRREPLSPSVVYRIGVHS